MLDSIDKINKEIDAEKNNKYRVKKITRTKKISIKIKGLGNEDDLLPYIIDGKLDYPESLKKFVEERILAYCKTVA